MKTRGATLAILILSFLGLADAWYLGDAALTGTQISCNTLVLSGCNIVAASKYSHLFGIPLGVYGALFYAAVFMLAALALVMPDRRTHIWLFFLTIAGALISLVLATIQATVIHA